MKKYNLIIFILLNFVIATFISYPLVFAEEGDGMGGSCFLAGTKILMFDNSLKNIEDVKVGDKVLSYDFRTKKIVSQMVLELEMPIRNHYYNLILEDETILKVTDEHPLYSKIAGKNVWASINPENTLKYDKMFVQKLNLGDYVLKNDLSWSKVVKFERFEGDVQTYNLKKINRTHTFFAENILVHNKDGSDSGESDAADGEAEGNKDQAEVADPVLEGDGEGEDGEDDRSFMDRVADFFSSIARAIGFAIGVAVSAVTGGLAAAAVSAATGIASIGVTGNTPAGHAIGAAVDGFNNAVNNGKKDAMPSQPAEGQQWV